MLPIETRRLDSKGVSRMRPISSCLTIIVLSSGLALATTGPSSALGSGFHGGGHAGVAFGHAGAGRGFRHGIGGFGGRHHGAGAFAGGRYRHGRFGYHRGYGYGYGGYGYGYGLDGYGLGYGGYGGGVEASYPAAGPGGFIPVFMPVALGIREAPVKPPALYVIDQGGSRTQRRPRWRSSEGAATTGKGRARVAILGGTGRDDGPPASGPRIIRVPDRAR